MTSRTLQSQKSEVIVDWQRQWCCSANCSHLLHAVIKHTNAPINHTRPSSCKHSPDGATHARKQTSDYSLLLIYRPRKDESLSWPSWQTCSGWFTHLTHWTWSSSKLNITGFSCWSYAIRSCFCIITWQMNRLRRQTTSYIHSWLPSMPWHGYTIT